MGATLSSRAEWTSATDKGGKLDCDEALLLEILRYTDALCKDHPREALVVFKRPFVWTSPLTFSSFEPLKQGEEYTFSGDGLVSVAKQETGDPHLSVTKVPDGVEIRALNFKQLQQVLSCAGEKRLGEVQLCLEANQDPIATIMGPGFASVGGVPGGSTTLLEVHERLVRERGRGVGEEGVGELDSAFRLLLLMNSLDLKMLHSSVREMGKHFEKFKKEEEKRELQYQVDLQAKKQQHDELYAEFIEKCHEMQFYKDKLQDAQEKLQDETERHRRVTQNLELQREWYLKRLADRVSKLSDLYNAKGEVTQDSELAGLLRQLIQEFKDDQRKDVCLVCYSNPKNCVFLPCKHQHTCAECAAKFTNCPVCRQSVSERMDVFV